jgi:hypothetical protein
MSHSLQRTLERDVVVPVDDPAEGHLGCTPSCSTRVRNRPGVFFVTTARAMTFDAGALINASIPFVSFAQSAVAAPVRSHRQHSACPLPYRGMLTNH